MLGVTVNTAGCPELTVALDMLVVRSPFGVDTAVTLTATDWLDELETVTVWAAGTLPSGTTNIKPVGAMAATTSVAGRTFSTTTAACGELVAPFAVNCTRP